MDALTTSSILGGSVLEDQRALQLALELSMLGLGDASALVTGATNSSPESHHHQSLTNGHPTAEQLAGLQKKSQNMTECVPVPSSEHVAEIVGRQGKQN